MNHQKAKSALGMYPQPHSKSTYKSNSPSPDFQRINMYLQNNNNFAKKQSVPSVPTNIDYKNSSYKK